MQLGNPQKKSKIKINNWRESNEPDAVAMLECDINDEDGQWRDQ